jgi:hypothetical protein
MRLRMAILGSAVSIILFAGAVRAQDLLVPAGTLLQCTLNEPNFSSKTASVGDPVVCSLRSLREFDRLAFPRGAMLGGHLEAAKDPGHLWGKGNLGITFDRVILPYGDLPVPAKVISAKGFKVDKKGDIDGKGHPRRDVVEWMFPPLWPWKVVSLPRRGPYPTLKGEEQLELRLMDDIAIPSTLAYGPFKPDRPPYASSAQPSSWSSRQSTIIRPTVRMASVATERAPVENSFPEPTARSTTIVLKSNDSYQVSKYRTDGNLLTFQQLDGTTSAVALNQVDWLRTSEMASRARSMNQPQITARIN